MGEFGDKVVQVKIVKFVLGVGSNFSFFFWKNYV